MGEASSACRAVGELCWAILHVAHQFRERFRRKLCVRSQHEGTRGDDRHLLEILDRIVGNLAGERRDGNLRDGGEEQRIAIRLRAGDVLRRDDSGRASLVLHDEGLT